eukprot:g2090.t1
MADPSTHNISKEEKEEIFNIWFDKVFSKLISQKSKGTDEVANADDAGTKLAGKLRVQYSLGTYSLNNEEIQDIDLTFQCTVPGCSKSYMGKGAWLTHYTKEHCPGHRLMCACGYGSNSRSLVNRHLNEFTEEQRTTYHTITENPNWKFILKEGADALSLAWVAFSKNYKEKLKADVIEKYGKRWWLNVKNEVDWQRKKMTRRIKREAKAERVLAKQKEEQEKSIAFSTGCSLELQTLLQQKISEENRPIPELQIIQSGTSGDVFEKSVLGETTTTEQKDQVKSDAPSEASQENRTTNEEEQVSRNKWTAKEDAILLQAIKQYGPKRWSTIAKYLPNRQGKQCRERWCNNLDPRLKRGPWGPQEEKILLAMHNADGNKWSKIARALNRTDNDVKNRWNSSFRRKMEWGIKMGYSDHNETIDRWFEAFGEKTIGATKKHMNAAERARAFRTADDMNFDATEGSDPGKKKRKRKKAKEIDFTLTRVYTPQELYKILCSDLDKILQSFSNKRKKAKK